MITFLIYYFLLPLAVAICVFLCCCYLDYVIEKIRRFLSHGDF